MKSATDTRTSAVLRQLREDFFSKTLGQLAREREAAACEIERLVAKIEATTVATLRPPDYPRPERKALLTIHEVCRLVGLSRSSIYAAMGSGRFPNGVKVSQRATRWPADEVQEWINRKLALGHSRDKSTGHTA